MDTLTIIITLVSFVAGVLQIILFFKVWGMCNDVRALRNQQCPEQPSQEGNANKSAGYSGILTSFLIVIIIFTLIVLLSAFR